MVVHELVVPGLLAGEEFETRGLIVAYQLN